MKKLTFLLLASLMLNLSVLVAETAHAAVTACPSGYTDEDGDGWVNDYHAGYRLGSLPTGKIYGDECTVSGGVIKKQFGDCVDLKPGDELNPNSNSIVKNISNQMVKSKTIYPGTTDIPGDGVDQSCAGADSNIGGGTTTTASGVMDNIRNFLTWVVGGISGIILIIGGIMYAMAAGDEQKTKRARKAMIGAVVGLVVALLANVIIGIVANNIVK
jgi:hypothetical protein